MRSVLLLCLVAAVFATRLSDVTLSEPAAFLQEPAPSRRQNSTNAPTAAPTAQTDYVATQLVTYSNLSPADLAIPNVLTLMASSYRDTIDPAVQFLANDTAPAGYTTAQCETIPSRCGTAPAAGNQTCCYISISSTTAQAAARRSAGINYGLVATPAEYAAFGDRVASAQAAITADPSGLKSATVTRFASDPSVAAVGNRIQSSSVTAAPAIVTTPTAASSSSGISGGAIAGIIIGCILVVVILVGIVYYVMSSGASKSAAAETETSVSGAV